MTVDEAIALCHHDAGERRELWKEVAFVTTAEVLRLRAEIERLKAEPRLVRTERTIVQMRIG